jgi:hypothetical protein
MKVVKYRMDRTFVIVFKSDVELYSNQYNVPNKSSFVIPVSQLPFSHTPRLSGTLESCASRENRGHQCGFASDLTFVMMTPNGF